MTGKIRINFVLSLNVLIVSLMTVSCNSSNVAIELVEKRKEFLENGPGFSLVLAGGFSGDEVVVKRCELLVFEGVVTTNASTGIARNIFIEGDLPFELSVFVDKGGGQVYRVDPSLGHEILVDLLSGEGRVTIMQNRIVRFLD